MEPARQKADQDQAQSQPRIEETLEPTSFFSLVFFLFALPILRFGSKHVIVEKMLPKLGKEFRPQPAMRLMSENMARAERGVREGMVLLGTVFKTFRGRLILCLIMETVYSVLLLVSPVLTRMIIDYIVSGQKNTYDGLGLTGLTLLVAFLYNLLDCHSFFQFSIVGYQLNYSLTHLIAEKALRYPSLYSKKYASGDLVTMSTVDASRMTYFAFYISSVLFLPVQISLGVYLMFDAMGPSFLAGLAVILLINIASYFISKVTKNANDKLMKARDQRNKLVTDMVNSIQNIKSNAFEEFYSRTMAQKRDKELECLRRQNYFKVLSIILLWSGPGIILSATFLLYFLIGNDITADRAFQVTIIFSILSYAIKAIPDSLNTLLQIWVSIQRIQKFLLDQDIYCPFITHDHSPDVAISLTHCTFSWEISKDDKDKDKDKGNSKPDKKDDKDDKDDKESKDQLNQSLLESSEEKKNNLLIAIKDVTLRIPKGKLTLIVGQTKSGKSSLLNAILGEMKGQGSINISGRISYCPQKPWVLNRTVQQNIIMADELDQDRFQLAIKSAVMESDMEEFPGGAKSELGEKGLNISGGQKARLSLARAVYNNGDIYLLDDILSAVDLHVSRKLVESCLLGTLKHKTRVLATHNLAVTKYADYIVLMHEGRVAEHGTLAQIKNKPLFQASYQAYMKSDVEHDEGQGLKQVKAQAGPKAKGQSGRLMVAEDRYVGQVPFSTYKEYVKLNGGAWFLLPLVMAVGLGTFFQYYSNVYIIKWCSSPRDVEFLILYMIISIGGGLLIGLRSFIMIFSTLRQGRRIFKQMIECLLNAPLSWWAEVPTGRIINRLTRDVSEIDQQLGFTTGWYVVCTFQTVVSLLVCVFDSSYYTLIPFFLFLVVCLFLKNYYMKSQRELTRLSAITRSPIASDFKQIIEGLNFIRAIGLQRYFVKKLGSDIGINAQAIYSSSANQNWFKVFLVVFSFILTATSISLAVFGDLSGPLVGLLLTYVFQLNQNVSSYVMTSAYVQNRMIAFQRCNNFTKIEAEHGLNNFSVHKEDQPLFPRGEVRFVNYSMRYKEGLPLALNKLNVTFKAGQKIGVVGRTGAGKSSLTQVLLRLVQGCEGQLLIDGIDVSKIRTIDLRNEITFVAQEPTLFNGSLRENLDPTGCNSDADIEEALRVCCMDSLLTQRNRLDTQITQNGSNLSVGQRQLLCLARAILKRSKLVLIDEATANIDVKTDQIIQRAIKERFINCTVVTIAHRINTIMHCDKILVMSRGTALEFDTPAALIKTGGQFYSLYKELMAEKQ